MRKLIGISIIAIFFTALLAIQQIPFTMASSTPSITNQIQQITYNRFNNTFPIVQVDSQMNSHIVWNGIDIYTPLYPIYYLSNRGAGEMGTLHERMVYQSYKDAAIDSNGTIHITMCTVNELIRSDIVYVNLSSGQFYPIVNLTHDVTNQFENKIAIDKNNKIHVIYSDEPFNLYYINTLTGWFGSPISIYTGAPTNQNTELALAVDSNGKVHIAWKNRIFGVAEIYYSNNIQGTFIQPLNISREISEDDSQPAIAIDSRNYVHITWVKGNMPSEICYRLYFPANGTLGTPINISQTPTWTESTPDICVDANNVTHIVFQGLTAADSEIFYVNNSKGTFDSPKNITTNIYADNHPSITADASNNIHIVWETYIDNFINLFYTVLIPAEISEEGAPIPGFGFLFLLIYIPLMIFWWIFKKNNSHFHF